MQQFDVIICGAGPAGSTCALGLFDAGLNVALLDKQSFPREKICGDAYGGYAHKILNTISPAFAKKNTRDQQRYYCETCAFCFAKRP